MSDERIIDIRGGDPGDPGDGGRPEDPTARLLRDVLTRAADDVEPSPDGLARIRAATAEHSRRPALLRRRPGGRPWLPVLAAAASVVLLAGLAGFALQRFPLQGSDERASDAASPSATAPPALPVYRVGVLDDGAGRVRYALFREFRQTVLTDLDARLSDALTEAVTRRPEDGDYDRVFGPASGGRVEARWDAAAGEIEVELTPAMTTVRVATDARAQIAIQQIVWTATAVLAEQRPGSADVPVRISVTGAALDRTMFGRPTYALGGTFTRAHGVDDPQAPVWLLDPPDGTQLGKEVTTVGLSVGWSGRDGVPWTLTRDGEVVARGVAVPVFTTPDPKPGSRGTATITIDHRAIGSYVLTAAEPPGTAGPVWSDTKAFLVN